MSDSIEEAQEISKNLETICGLLSKLVSRYPATTGQTSVDSMHQQIQGSSSAELPSLLEESTVILEELQAVLHIVREESNSVEKIVRSVENEFEKLESLWEKIDATAEYVGQKKKQLTELEGLCTCVERLIKVKTRSGAGKEGTAITREEEEDIFPVPQEDDFSDDDAPVEVSSKKNISSGPDIELAGAEPEEKSLFEQIQEKKKEEEAQKINKSRAKKLKRKKIGEGKFTVQTKTAKFNVISLDKGVAVPLEPARNYKAELLAARTQDRRVKDPKQAVARAKWCGRK